jgi:hypothetical protein
MVSGLRYDLLIPLFVMLLINHIFISRKIDKITNKFK